MRGVGVGIVVLVAVVRIDEGGALGRVGVGVGKDKEGHGLPDELYMRVAVQLGEGPKQQVYNRALRNTI